MHPAAMASRRPLDAASRPARPESQRTKELMVETSRPASSPMAANVTLPNPLANQPTTGCHGSPKNPHLWSSNFPHS